MSDFPRPACPMRPALSTFSEFGVGSEMSVGYGATAPASAVWPAANRAIYVPFFLPAPYLLRKFFWCNGATANGNVDAGIFSKAGTKIASTGSTAQAGTSVLQSAAPSGGNVWLDADSYYLALASSSGTATFLQRTIFADAVVGVFWQATAFALPATFTPGTAGGILPVFGIADVGTI